MKAVNGNSVVDDAEEAFTYNSLGRILTAVKKINDVTISETVFDYYDSGKVADVDETLFGGTTMEISYTYDQAGFPTSITYPDGNQIDITPDWRGRIDTIAIGNDDLVTYKYIGPRVAQRSYLLLNPDIDYEPTYDNLGRITSADSGTSYAKFDYLYQANTNNISRQTYDHRSGDPYTTFSYDDLARLTTANYGTSDDEVFTLDDLGNRDLVNLRDSNNVDYVIDANNNRYISVGGNSLAYNKAGGLETDKDSYEYEYDYENRIVEINDVNGVRVAEFAYDALGRRIEKKDLVNSNNTRRYYYNNNWQVLSEYDGSGDFQRFFIYGNYIDEVLMTSDSSDNDYYYVHDHLYSPAALINSSATA